MLGRFAWASLSDRVAVKPGPGREKAHCDALLAQMRRSGLMAVGVPRRLGGPELDLGTIAVITHEIARQSGSAGLVSSTRSTAAPASAGGSGASRCAAGSTGSAERVSTTRWWNRKRATVSLAR